MGQIEGSIPRHEVLALEKVRCEVCRSRPPWTDDSGRPDTVKASKKFLASVEAYRPWKNRCLTVVDQGVNAHDQALPQGRDLRPGGRGLPHHALETPWPRRGRLEDDPGARPGGTRRSHALATTRPGYGSDRRTPPVPQLQAGQHPPLA